MTKTDMPDEIYIPKDMKWRVYFQPHELKSVYQDEKEMTSYIRADLAQTPDGGALEALEVIELESYKPEHKQKSISDEIDIVRSFITKVTRRPITDGDINEALEWMADKRRFLENCTEGSPEYIAARKEDLRIVLFIERALTAHI